MYGPEGNSQFVFPRLEGKQNQLVSRLSPAILANFYSSGERKPRIFFSGNWNLVTGIPLVS